MIEISVEQGKDTKKIFMGGSLTAEHAAEIMVTLREALALPMPDITLTLGAVTKVDATFFQLLCSTQRKATNSGKSFIIEKINQKPMLRALRLMGFSRSKSCICEATQPCLFERIRG